MGRGRQAGGGAPRRGHGLSGEPSCLGAHPCSVTHLLGKLPSVVKLEF